MICVCVCVVDIFSPPEQVAGAPAEHASLFARVNQTIGDVALQFLDRQRLFLLYVHTFGARQPASLLMLKQQLQAQACAIGLPETHVDGALQDFVARQPAPSIASVQTSVGKALDGMARRVAEAATAATTSTLPAANARMRHQPRIGQLVMQALDDRLDERVFGSIDSTSSSAPALRRLVVFVHGGITQVEAAYVQSLVATRKDAALVSVVLGGTQLLGTLAI
jgi:hypothetical protein